jgi:hypothetical protein
MLFSEFPDTLDPFVDRVLVITGGKNRFVLLGTTHPAPFLDSLKDFR